MILFIILLIALSLIFSFFISNLLPLSRDLHQICLSFAPQTEWNSYYQAIVCGKNLPQETFYFYLQKLGILHIIVVSGSHLVFLSQGINYLPRSLARVLNPITLTLFALVGNMEAPVVRALLSLGLFKIKTKWKLFYTHYHVLLMTSLVCLFLFPEWYLSKSLLLSCGAALGIQLSKNIFLQSFFCYLILTPLISDFSSLSPITLLTNSLITPIVGVFLFPISLFAFIIPIETFTDKMWSCFYLLCQHISLRTDSNTFRLSSLAPIYQWIYIFSLHLLFMKMKTKRWIS